MKRKFFTAAALAGLLAVSGVPMGVAAEEVDVQYVTGGAVDPDTPPAYQGTYYVELPANVTFTKEGDSRDMNVYLRAYDNDKGLPEGLEVNVSVKSANSFDLITNGTSVKAAYSLTYGQTTLNNESPTKADANQIGTLKNDKTQLEGTATLTTEPTQTVANGTVFSDTLTYTVKHIAPTK